MLYGIFEINKEINNFDNSISNNYRKLYHNIIISEIIQRNKDKMTALQKRLKQVKKLSRFY